MTKMSTAMAIALSLIRLSTTSNACVLLVWLVFTIPSTVDGFFRRDSRVDVALNLVNNSGTIGSATALDSRHSGASSAMVTAADEKRTLLRPDVERLLEKEEEEYQRAKASSTCHGVDNDDHTASQEDLVFEGTFEYESDLLPLHTMSYPKDLLDFFLSPENRDLVVKGGGNPCETIPRTNELDDEWISNSKVVKSTPPNGQNEEILAVHSDVHLVPGLSISAVSYTGCKVLIHPQSLLPSYEFTLVKEDYQGKGRRALVWVFNKITGKHRSKNSNDGISQSTTDNDSSDDHDGSSRTFALSRVTIQHDVQQNGCRVCYYGHVKVVSKLPKRLLRFLPLPKHTVEAKVSHAIVSQLEKEGVNSINKFAEALGTWAEARHPHN
jgi:hypothetical protein